MELRNNGINEGDVVSSIRADSNPQLTGDVTLASGTGITLAQSGQTITINSTADLSVTLADVSANSLTTPNSLYTMTSTIPVEFKTSDAHTLLYLDETNERVGIGTASPTVNFHIQQALDVIELIESTTVGQSASMQFKNNAGTAIFGQNGSPATILVSGTGGLNYATVIVSPPSQAIQFAPNSNVAMTLLSGGNVGIGTTGPTDKLQVQGGAVSYITSDWAAGTTGSMLQFSKSASTGNVVSTIQSYIAGAAAYGNISLNALGGNVGIGTTNPASGYLLEVSGATAKTRLTSTTGTNAAWQEFSNTGSKTLVGIESSTGGSLFVGSSAYASVIGHDGARSLQFATNNTVRATIDSSGNVGIGTTNPTSPLVVKNGSNNGVSLGGTGQVDAIGINRDILTGSIYDSGRYAFQFTNNGAAANTLTLDVYNGGGTGIGTALAINSSANVGIGTASPTAAKLVVQDTNLFSDPIASFKATGGSGSGLIQLDRDNTGRMSGIQFSTSGTTNWFAGMYYTGSSQGKFGIGTDYTDANQKFVIDTNGNVGIGVTAPPGKLTVLSANSGATNDIMFTNDAAGNYRNGIANSQSSGSAAGNTMTFRIGDSSTTGQTSVMVLRGDGNVGIGTTGPNQKLSVNGNIELQGAVGTTRYIITDENSAGTGKVVVQAGAGSAAYGGAINLYANAHATKPGDVAVGLSAVSGAKFRVNDQGLDGGNDLFTVLRTGNVGIGTTGPADLLSVYAGDATVARVDNSTSKGFYLKTGSTYDWGFRSLTGTSDLTIRAEGAAGEVMTLTKSTGLVGVGIIPSGNGLLQVKSGAATTQFSKVGGVIFDHFVDAGNVGTGEDTLYTDTIAAATLTNNGDKITATYAGIFNGAALSTQELRLYFGGTKIYDSGALSIGAATDNWTVYVTCIRVSSSVVRCTVSVATDFATLFPYSVYTEVTGLTLTNTQILKITGEAAGAGALDDQIVAKLGVVEWKSAS